MVEIAATVFVLVVAHIYIRAYLEMATCSRPASSADCSPFCLRVGGMIVFSSTHILVIAGGIALAAGLQAAGVLNRPAEWGKGKRIV